MSDYQAQIHYSGCNHIPAVQYKCPECEIERLEDELKQANAACKTAHDHLMNLQPHIEQLPESTRPFIDTHVDLAMEALKEHCDD